MTDTFLVFSRYMAPGMCQLRKLLKIYVITVLLVVHYVSLFIIRKQGEWIAKKNLDC